MLTTLAVVNTYTVLKTIHVLAAATWVGGGSLVTMLSARARRGPTPERFAELIRTIEPIAKVVFPGSGLILIITGMWMVGNADLDFDTWLVLGVIGWAYSLVAGAAVIGPTVGKIVARFDEGGPADPAAAPLISRYMMLTRIDSLVLGLVIIDMVLKPGAQAAATRWLPASSALGLPSRPSSLRPWHPRFSLA